MSLLERWVANTKRVLAKDKNTEIEYEFESVFPDGAPDGTAFSAENMNKIIDAVNGLDESKAQPSGIATLDSSGKLAQMPTAADVGAIKLNWSMLMNEETETPNKYSFAVYITPGDVVSVCNYASARSVTDIPEQVPGKLYVLPLRTDDQGRNDLMQEYHTTTGNVWIRCRYYYSGNTWSNWASGALKPMQPYVSTQLTGSGYVYFACYGLDAGSYIFTACGNFNKGGSDDYRAVYTLIIHVSCDWDTQNKTVIAGVSYAPLLVTCNFGSATDDKLDVGFNNMIKTTPWAAWQSGNEPGKIYISAASSTSSSVSDWSCKLLKLI